MCEKEQAAVLTEPKVGWNFPDDLLEAAWGIIANAYGGAWELAGSDWRKAAERWRDEYHAHLCHAEQEKQGRADLPNSNSELKPDEQNG